MSNYYEIYNSSLDTRRNNTGDLNAFNAGNIEATNVPVTPHILGANQGKEFWLQNNNAATIVVSVGSLAIVVGIIALLWKYLKGSSGTGCTPSTSAPPPPPQDDCSDIEAQSPSYKRQLEIYNSICEKKDTDLNNNEASPLSPQKYVNNQNIKDDGDPHVLDEITAKEGWGQNNFHHYSPIQNIANSDRDRYDSISDDMVYDYAAETPTSHVIPRVFRCSEFSTPL